MVVAEELAERIARPTASARRSTTGTSTGDGRHIADAVASPARPRGPRRRDRRRPRPRAHPRRRRGATPASHRRRLGRRRRRLESGGSARRSGFPPPGDVRRCSGRSCRAGRPSGPRSSTASTAASSRATPSATCSSPRSGRQRAAVSSKGSPRLRACSAPLGRVLPATAVPVTLAEAAGGERRRAGAVMGRSGISPRVARARRRAAAPEALDAIAAADQVVIGPGSLYTSVLAALAPVGWPRRSPRPAARIYVCNLRRAGARDLRLRRRRPRSRPWRRTALCPTSSSVTRSCDRCDAGGYSGRRRLIEATVGSARRAALARPSMRLAAVTGTWRGVDCVSRGHCSRLSGPATGRDRRQAGERRCRMTVRVAVNGFGRIGRNFLRARCTSGADVELVAVNDLVDRGDQRPPAQYDSTHGRLADKVEADGQCHHRRRHTRSQSSPSGTRRRFRGATSASMSSSSRPGASPTRETAAAHIEAGATRVIISAPADQRRRHLRRRRQRRHLRPRQRTTSSPTPRARRTASSRWSRFSTTPSAWRRA